jgi:hypothetical protein
MKWILLNDRVALALASRFGWLEYVSCFYFRSGSGAPELTTCFLWGSDSVIKSLVLYVCLYIVVCPFSFGHCAVCQSSIYGFWLPLWYLQTLQIHSLTDTYPTSFFFFHFKNIRSKFENEWYLNLFTINMFVLLF